MKVITCLFFLFSLFGIQTYAGDAARTASIMVEGVCRKFHKNDRFRFNFSATHNHPKVQQATQMTFNQYNQLLAHVKKMKLRHLQLKTKNYHVHEDYRWQNGRRVSKGYRATMTLQIETSSQDKIGEILALGGKLNYKSAHMESSFLAKETRESLYNECLVEAAQKTRFKADRIAKGLGERIKGVLQAVEKKGVHQVQHRRVYRESLAKTADMSRRSTPQFEQGQAEVEVKLTVEYALN